MPNYTCPICGYHGAFIEQHARPGTRLFARCPRCNSLERHRLQYLALSDVLRDYSPSLMSCLHFAPEECFRDHFKKTFGLYHTADLLMPDVDFQVDITNLPFEDRSYDILYASHILEHVADDEKALSEIERVLTLSGLACLPVPIVSDTTTEYHYSNPNESGHVRAPGLDYFEKFRRHFKTVNVYSSHDYNGDYQLFIHEDRTQWPSRDMPLRKPAQGDKHPDYVPICKKG